MIGEHADGTGARRDARLCVVKLLEHLRSERVDGRGRRVFACREQRCDGRALCKVEHRIHRIRPSRVVLEDAEVLEHRADPRAQVLTVHPHLRHRLLHAGQLRHERGPSPVHLNQAPVHRLVRRFLRLDLDLGLDLHGVRLPSQSRYAE